MGDYNEERRQAASMVRESGYVDPGSGLREAFQTMAKYAEEEAKKPFQVPSQTKRRGDWMETYTGKKVWPLDVRDEDVDIKDIARSLSMQCRYNGHVKFFYSVAAHCCIMADHAFKIGGAGYAFAALLHDASEAYITDVVRPLKPFLQGYKEHELMVDFTIARVYGLAFPMPAWLKELDNRILLDERAVLMDKAQKNHWQLLDGLKPLGIAIPNWGPERAEDEFLDRFNTYQSMLKAA